MFLTKHQQFVLCVNRSLIVAAMLLVACATMCTARQAMAALPNGQDCPPYEGTYSCDNAGCYRAYKAAAGPECGNGYDGSSFFCCQYTAYNGFCMYNGGSYCQQLYWLELNSDNGHQENATCYNHQCNAL